MVLIAAFEPFAGHQGNSGATVERVLQDRIPGVCVVTEILPVSWNQVEERVPALVVHWKPRVLEGLGEGPAAHVMVERVAHHIGMGVDAVGREPRQGRLLLGGPKERRSTMEFDVAWKLSRDVAVMHSDDSGQYLTNALRYSALAQPVPRVGLVHLPSQGTETEEIYAARYVPIITGIVQHNLPMPSTSP